MDQLTLDLQQTIEFIKSHKWTRGALARTPQRTPWAPRSPSADRWCLLGAAMAANDVSISSDRLVAIDTAVLAEAGVDAHHYNDFVAKDKRYIIRLLNRIIKRRTPA